MKTKTKYKNTTNMTDLLHIIHRKLHNTKHIKFIRISANFASNLQPNPCGGTGTPQNPWRYDHDKISAINKKEELFEILITNGSLIIRLFCVNSKHTQDTYDLSNPQTDITKIITKINKLTEEYTNAIIATDP